MRILLALLASLAVLPPARADRAAWDLAVSGYEAAEKDRSTETAERFAREAWDLAKVEFQKTDPHHVHSLIILGKALLARGKFDEAEQTLALALETLDAGKKWPAPVLHGVFDATGDLRMACGKPDEALPWLKRAMEVLETAEVKDERILLGCMDKFAHILEGLGKLEESERYRVACLKRAEIFEGVSEGEAVSMALNNLSALYLKMGKVNEAEPLCHRYMALATKRHAPDHLQTAYALNRMAQLHEAQGHDPQALEAYVKVLNILMKQFGPGHPHSATTLYRISKLYDKHGDPAQAEKGYKAALMARERLLPPDHPDLLEILETYGNFLSRNNRAAEAIPLLERAGKIRTARKPPSP